MRTREQSPDAGSESGIMQPSTVPQIIVFQNEKLLLMASCVEWLSTQLQKR